MKGHSYNPNGCPKCGKVHVAKGGYSQHKEGCQCASCRSKRGDSPVRGRKRRS